MKHNFNGIKIYLKHKKSIKYVLVSLSDLSNFLTTLDFGNIKFSLFFSFYAVGKSSRGKHEAYNRG